MNIGNIRHYIHIVLAITCLLGVMGRQHTAVAQSSARHYELGDVYIFPDGSSLVPFSSDSDVRSVKPAENSTLPNKTNTASRIDISRIKTLFFLLSAVSIVLYTSH